MLCDFRMEKMEKIPAKLLENISNSVSLPYIITDLNGVILAKNQAAELVFENILGSKSLSDLFQSSESPKIRAVLSFGENEEIKSETLELKNRKGIKNSYKITTSVIDKSFEQSLIGLTFSLVKNEFTGDIKINLGISDIEEKFLNKEIITILDEIKSEFPFSFLGKNKIQNLIDSINEYFWIKDKNERYILANHKFASLLGLKPVQLEGRSESNFLPPFLSELFSSLNSFIKSTLNSVSVIDNKIKGQVVKEVYETIEIPLLDSDNILIAYIGIAQPFAQNSYNKSTNYDLNFFPFPAFIFDKDFVIKENNSYFENYIQKNEIQKNPEKITELFSKPLCIKIKNRMKGGESFKISPDLIKSNDVIFNFKEIDSKNGFYLAYEETYEINFNLEFLLKNRGEMFDLIVKNNPEAIFVYDPDNLRFLEVNDAALKLYGYTKPEFLQMDLTDLYTPEEIQTILEPQNNVEGVFTGPFNHRKKDGRIVKVEISRTSFTYEGREAFFNIVKDISDKLIAERELSVYKRIFEVSEDLLLITDSTGFITYANPSVSRVLGYSKDELLSESIVSLVEDKDRTAILKRSKEKVSVETKLKTKVGNFIDYTITTFTHDSGDTDNLSYIFIGSKPGTATEVIVEKPVDREVIREVIVEKPVDREVIREIIVEKPVIKEVIKEVFVSGEQNQHQNQGGLDPSHLSFIFHEILTPINVMIGFMNEIKESLDSPNEEQREALEYINENNKKLRETMDSISEYAQIEQEMGQFKPDTFDAEKLLKAVVKETEESTKEFQYTVEIERVSYGLKITSDFDKTKTLVYLILKILSHVHKDGKFYISIFQLEDKNFIVGIRDGENEVSTKVMDILKNLYNKTDLSYFRNFGISRFSIFPALRLIDELKSKLEIIQKSGKSFEAGISLPIEFITGELTKEKIITPVSSASAVEKFTEFEDFKITVPKSDINNDYEFDEKFTDESLEKELENFKRTSPIYDRYKDDYEYETYDKYKFESREREETKDPPLSEKYSTEVQRRKADYDEPLPVKQEVKKEQDDFAFELNNDDFTSKGYEVQPPASSVFNKEEFKPKSETTKIPVQPNQWVNEPFRKPEKQAAESKPSTIKTPEKKEQPAVSTVAPVVGYRDKDGKIVFNNMTCLYIEDQLDSQILFKVQMKDIKELKFAQSFEDAEPLLENNKFDFIVMDINLQGEYNGLDALKLVRQMPAFEKTPIIAVTAYVLPGDKERFIATGFTDFISKPIFRNKMIEVLDKIF